MLDFSSSGNRPRCLPWYLEHGMTSPSRQGGLSGREVSRHANQGGLIIAGATNEERRVALVCDMSEMKDKG